MKFSRNAILVILAVTGGIILLVRSNKEGVDSIDQQIANAQNEANNRYLTSGSDTPLSNTNSTLSTIVAQNSALRNEMATVRETVNTQRNEIDRLRRQNEKPGSSEEVTSLRQHISELQQSLSQLKDDILSSKSDPNSQLTVNDITGADIQPIDIPVSSTPSSNGSNSLIDVLVQPSTAPSNDGRLEPIQTTQATPNSMVRIIQSDIKFEQNKEGEIVKTYPVRKKETAATETTDAGSPSTGTAANAEKPKPVPMYTIPSTATLFGSVSMSAIIGRVPIDNAVSNPFRFKVLVGSSNLATNGIYIPNLEDMVLSGYAEGDFTMECARGNIDTATFTFKDGTIRTVKSSQEKPIGWLSDAAGIPCIAGQYITNFPAYAAKQGGLKMLSAFAASIAGSAVTTSTSAEGVTTSVVNDASKKALGDGFQGGVDEITKWYAERQGSAFDVVYVVPGEPVVINIEEELQIDYELDGRKTVHNDNIQEYMAW